MLLPAVVSFAKIADVSWENVEQQLTKNKKEFHTFKCRDYA